MLHRRKEGVRYVALACSVAGKVRELLDMGEMDRAASVWKIWAALPRGRVRHMYA